MVKGFNLMENNTSNVRQVLALKYRPKRFEESYSPEGHAYHESIPMRLDELKWILKNIK